MPKIAEIKEIVNLTPNTLHKSTKHSLQK